MLLAPTGLALPPAAPASAAANTITFGDASYYAPNIDKITVAPAVPR